METYYELAIEEYEIQSALVQCTVALEGLCTIEDLPSDNLTSQLMKEKAIMAHRLGMEASFAIFTIKNMWEAVVDIIELAREYIMKFIKWVKDYLNADVRRVKKVMRMATKYSHINVDIDRLIPLSEPITLLKDITQPTPTGISNLVDRSIAIDSTAGKISHVVENLTGELVRFNKAIKENGNIRVPADIDKLLIRVTAGWNWVNSLVGDLSENPFDVVKNGKWITTSYDRGYMGNGQALVFNVSIRNDEPGKVMFKHSYVPVPNGDLIIVKQIKALKSDDILAYGEVFIRHNEKSNQYSNVLKDLNKALKIYVKLLRDVSKSINDSNDLGGVRSTELTKTLNTVSKIATATSVMAQSVFANNAKNSGLLTNALIDLAKHLAELDA